MSSHFSLQTVGLDGTKLSDICFKPVNGVCTIQTALEYFQNQQENLHVTGSYGRNYIDHMSNCFQNPFLPEDSDVGLPCLGSYGGPVFPYTGLIPYWEKWKSCTVD